MYVTGIVGNFLLIIAHVKDPLKQFKFPSSLRIFIITLVDLLISCTSLLSYIWYTCFVNKPTNAESFPFRFNFHVLKSGHWTILVDSISILASSQYYYSYMSLLGGWSMVSLCYRESRYCYSKAMDRFQNPVINGSLVIHVGYVSRNTMCLHCVLYIDKETKYGYSKKRW